MCDNFEDLELPEYDAELLGRTTSDFDIDSLIFGDGMLNLSYLLLISMDKGSILNRELLSMLVTISLRNNRLRPVLFEAKSSEVENPSKLMCRFPDAIFVLAITAYCGALRRSKALRKIFVEI